MRGGGLALAVRVAVARGVGLPVAALLLEEERLGAALCVRVRLGAALREPLGVGVLLSEPLGVIVPLGVAVSV